MATPTALCVIEASTDSNVEMNYRRPDKERLGFFPTPLVELPRLAERLGGPRIVMKRDDQTGLAMGGNKTRKLEYLLADALARGADTLVTAGAAQSNHCRQTAAAAAAHGMECHLVLGGSEPGAASGNYLLDRLLGARVHWAGESRKGETIPSIVAALVREGRRPYEIPYGGSNELGAAAFVEAMVEVDAQLADTNRPKTHVVFASSSGGTHAGLILGKHLLGTDVRLIGIQIDKEGVEGDAFRKRVADLARSTAEFLDIHADVSEADVDLRPGYVGEGYGVLSDLDRRAITETARAEGILLDPVYTGRAMGGLIDLIERGEFAPEDTVLFWHTGGTPALFACSEQLAY